jgi:hypothetical protein
VADAFALNTIELGNMLAWVQHDTEQLARAAGKLPQHARLKAARAGVNAIWRLFMEHDAARSTNITVLATRAKRTAPMQAKYSTTWDLQLVFDYWLGEYSRGRRFTAAAGPARWSMRDHRASAIMLWTFASIGRAGDALSLCTGYFTGEPGAGLCLMGNKTLGTITKVRFYDAKTAGVKLGRYGAWITLAYLDKDANPALEGLCVRTALETYQARRRLALCGDDKFFVSTRATRERGGLPRYNGLSRDTVRHDAERIMRLAGVPEMFLPHSSRAATARAVVDCGGTEQDVLKRADMSSGTYRRHYDKVMGREDDDDARGPSDEARAVLGWIQPSGRGARRRFAPAWLGGGGAAPIRTDALQLEDRVAPVD